MEVIASHYDNNPVRCRTLEDGKIIILSAPKKTTIAMSMLDMAPEGFLFHTGEIIELSDQAHNKTFIYKIMGEHPFRPAFLCDLQGGEGGLMDDDIIGIDPIGSSEYEDRLWIQAHYSDDGRVVTGVSITHVPEKMMISEQLLSDADPQYLTRPAENMVGFRDTIDHKVYIYRLGPSESLWATTLRVRTADLVEVKDE